MVLSPNDLLVYLERRPFKSIQRYNGRWCRRRWLFCALIGWCSQSWDAGGMQLRISLSPFLSRFLHLPLSPARIPLYSSLLGRVNREAIQCSASFCRLRKDRERERSFPNAGERTGGKISGKKEEKYKGWFDYGYYSFIYINIYIQMVYYIIYLYTRI